MNKPNLVTVLFILSTQLLCAQEFEFTIYFEDSIGNVDSLILGLDDSATSGIDDFWGELNIIGEPLQNEMDVRVSDEWSARLFDGNEGTYHTKKQIIHSLNDIIEINVKSNHFPITAKWDSSLFQNGALNGTLITSITPGGWWDTGSPSDLGRVIPNEKDSIKFSSNYLDFNSLNHYSYITETHDTISVFWFAFGSEGIGVKTKNIELPSKIRVYPNPVNESIKIHNSTQIKIEGVLIFNQIGQKIMEFKNEPMNVAHLSAGCYWIKIRLQNGQEIIKPIIKN